MVGMGDMANTLRREEGNEYRCTCLWSLATCSDERAGVYHLRVQLRTPANRSRLALLWRFLSLHCGALYRDVRVSFDHLPAFRVAWQRFPRDRPALAQYGAFVGNAAGLAR